ncbi:putative peptide ABC transporter, ATP-binding domain protein, partial [Vibrio parahaemolyticus V-223/04]
IRY